MGKKSPRSIYRDGVENDTEIEQEAKKEMRQQILSNEKILYLYSKTSHIIHEKTCKEARAISDDDLGISESYMPEFTQCEMCFKRAYLRMGAKDWEASRDYEKFFDSVNISSELLRRMHLEEQVKTRICGNFIMVWCKEDVWKIEALSAKGKVRLWHNNYYSRQDGSRKFVLGFHIQNEKCRSATFKYALDVMTNYYYDEQSSFLHKRQMSNVEESVKGDESKAGMDIQSSQQNQKITVWECIKKWFENILGRK